MKPNYLSIITFFRQVSFGTLLNRGWPLNRWQLNGASIVLQYCYTAWFPLKKCSHKEPTTRGFQTNNNGSKSDCKLMSLHAVKHILLIGDNYSFLTFQRYSSLKMRCPNSVTSLVNNKDLYGESWMFVFLNLRRRRMRINFISVSNVSMLLH